MLTPQTIGTIFDLIKVIGGALITLGVLKITNDQLSMIITQGAAILVAGVGLVAVVGPIVRSMYVRTRAGSIALASANLEPGERIKVNDQALADAIPSKQVIGPAGV